MNGIAVLVSLAAVGVDYGWQPSADGQLEYIIQIEPGLLEDLKNGEEIVSEIAPEARGVRRFRIRVGEGNVPRIGHLQPGTATRSLTSNPSDPPAGSTGAGEVLPPGGSEPRNSFGSGANGTGDIFGPDGFLNLPPPPPLLGADGKSSVLVRPGSSSSATGSSVLPPAGRSDGSLDLDSPPGSGGATGALGDWRLNSTDAEITPPSTGGVYPPRDEESSFPTGPSVPAGPTYDDHLTPPENSRPVRPVPSPSTDSSTPNPIRFGRSGIMAPAAGGATSRSDGAATVPVSAETDNSDLLAQVSDADAASLKPEIDEETAKSLEKPWTPLVLTSLALFASLAANVYLGWVALGIYRRYRDMVGQLHQAQASLT